MRYRSKPSEIEAVQWTGDNRDVVFAFAPDGRPGTDRCVVEMRSTVPLGWEGYEALYLLAGKDVAQGWVPVPLGHWIVRSPGDLSDHWPVDPDYFAGKYDRASVQGGDSTP